MRWPARVSMLLTCLGLLGCTTFSGVKPIYPDVGNPNYLSSVDSLQPTFRWEAVPDAESYDFIIYESIKTESFWEGSKRSVGREAKGFKALNIGSKNPLARIFVFGR
jgi:hypothetical protein